MTIRAACAAALLPLLFAGGALAAEARLAVQTETSSIDPHYAVVGANQVVAEHIFESLLATDSALRPIPGLASWRLIGETDWEFKVRPGARFHDGSPVTAEDIRFSLERMPNVSGSPAPFVRLAGLTKSLEVTAPDTLVLHAKQFDPAVPLHATQAWIVSAHAAQGATSADFNAGRAAIGSGPWRFVEWRPGERLVLERTRPDMPFERAIIRPIGSDAARLSALLAGDVDLIDSVPPSDLTRLKGDPKVKLWTAPSARVIYIALDQEHPVQAQIHGIDGKPLAANPLLDPRVRRALSLAVNRLVLVDRILYGAGHPAGQLVPEGLVGYDPAIGAPPFDQAQARKLLAEAGYPQGFKLVLTSPNNRYVEDDKTAQAVAQMWSRIGVVTDVDVMPSSAFFSRAAKREFAAFLIGFGSTAGDSYTAMSQVVHTYDTDTGLGTLNRFRFSDPAVDAALERSQHEHDPARREVALQEAAHIAFEQDTALVALHFPDNVFATRAGFAYTPRMAEGAMATLLKPAP